MDHRLASAPRPAHAPWPTIDHDEDDTPFEEWALDEVDGGFALSTAHAHQSVDASFD